MKITGKILTALDYVATTIGFLTALMILVISVVGAFQAVCKYISHLWSNGSDRWVCIAALISIGWCVARWKKLNSN